MTENQLDLRELFDQQARRGLPEGMKRSVPRMAEDCQVSVQALYNLFHGEVAEPTDKTIALLARGMGVSMAAVRDAYDETLRRALIG